MDGRIGRLPSPSSHPNTTCHFNSSPPPPLSLQTVKWRGIQESVGVVYRVDEQCGMAGELRCVNFMPSFFLVTHPPIPNILQMNARIFIAHLHLHLLHLSLPKTSGRVLHHWPSPSHCSRPSPLNKHWDNTVNDEHRHEHTWWADDHPLVSSLSDVKGAFLLWGFLRCLTNINLNLDHPPMYAPSSLTSSIMHSAPIQPILHN